MYKSSKYVRTGTFLDEIDWNPVIKAAESVEAMDAAGVPNC